MRKLLLLCFCVFCAFGNYVYAHKTYPTGSGEHTTRLHEQPRNNQRPRTMVPSWIDCTYCDGELIFSSDYDIEDIDVYITESRTGETWYYYIIDANQSVYMTLPPAEYRVLCITKDGEQYDGLLHI